MKKSYFIPAIIAAASLGYTLPATAVAQAVEDPAAASAAQPAQPTGQTPVPAAQIVDREFGAYDLDKSGKLDSTEFAAWISKLRAPPADGAPPTDITTLSDQLFARADADHDQLVDKSEMKTLLTTAQG